MSKLAELPGLLKVLVSAAMDCAEWCADHPDAAANRDAETLRAAIAAIEAWGSLL